MIMLTETLLIILIILTMLLQSVNLRILSDDRIKLEISFTIFSIQIDNFNQTRKKRKPKLTKRLRRLAFITRIASELLHHSRVNVISFPAFHGLFLESEGKVSPKALSSPMLLLYLQNNAAEYLESPGDSNRIDIIFTFSLGSLFISWLKASYYVLKSKIKRGIKSAR